MSTAPEPKRRGRPPLPPEQRAETPVRTLRLSDEHWAELGARGGVQGLREWLDGPRPARRKSGATSTK